MSSASDRASVHIAAVGLALNAASNPAPLPRFAIESGRQPSVVTSVPKASVSRCLVDGVVEASRECAFALAPTCAGRRAPLPGRPQWSPIRAPCASSFRPKRVEARRSGSRNAIPAMGGASVSTERTKGRHWRLSACILSGNLVVAPEALSCHGFFGNAWAFRPSVDSG